MGKVDAGQARCAFEGDGREFGPFQCVVGEGPEREVVIDAGELELVTPGVLEVSGEEAEVDPGNSGEAVEELAYSVEQGDV